MTSRRPWVLGPLGALASRTGEEMAATAILLLAYVLGAEGGVIVGVMSVLGGIGGPLLGVALDRARSTRPFVVTLISYAASIAFIGVALSFGAPLLAIALAAVAGLFSPAVSSGWSTFLRSDDPAHTRRLSTLDAATYSVASLGGPALAGGIHLVGGGPTAVAVAVALIAVGAVFAPFLRTATAVPTSVARRHPLRDIVEGARAIGRNVRLRSATIASCVAFAGFGMMAVVIPVLGDERFGDPGLGPMLLAVVAAAALVANAVSHRLGALRAPHVVFAAAMALTAVGLALLAPHLPPAVAIIAAVLIGSGDGPQLAALIHIRHLEAPEGLRAQVFTTGASLKIAASGVGAMAAAALTGLGTPVVLALAAALHVVGAVIAIAPGDARRID